MTQEILRPSISSFSVTVLGVSNIKPVHRFSLRYPQLFVSVAKGDQRFQTSIFPRAKSVLCNETYEFAVKDDQPNEVQIDLHRKKGDGSQRFLGNIHEQLDSLEPDTEIKRKFSSGATVIFKVSLTRKMTSKPDRIFALIIGINEYKSDKHMNLRGCVNDARAMGLFLSSLKVPDSNIVTLTNADATREAILFNFEKHLIRNTRIGKDDPIIFFYAGHGSRVEAPSEWETSDGKIETICPHDEWMLGKDGKEIPGIPSRTVNTLLRTLAGEKGNNITAIFDSCHSGAIARIFTTRSGEELVTRCTSNGCPIKDPKLDADICGPGRYAKLDIPGQFLYDSMSSHVLLAACKLEEPAYESTTNKGECCGAFTNALITTLYSAPLDRLTYEEFIKLLPSLPRQQIPQCGGIHIKRFLFNALVPPAEEYRNSFQVKRRGTVTNGTEAGESEYEVEAGLVHGVSIGTEFSIQSTDYAGPVSSKYLGVLVAKTVHAESSILVRRDNDPNFEVPLTGARAIISNWKNDASILKVFIHPEDRMLGGYLEPSKEEETMEEKLRKQCYARVPTREDAEVVLRYYPNVHYHPDQHPDQAPGVLEIERTDKIVGVHARPVIRANLPQKELTRLPFILDGIALFRYHLLRVSGDQTMLQGIGSSGITDGVENVEMHLYRLGLPQLSNGGYRQPISEENLLKENQARLQSSEDDRYGIKITNKTRHSFFPYLFYFDPSDYSIERWSYPYAPRMNAPLRARQGSEPGKVTVGYGHGGGDPIQFISGDDPEDTGFMKLFVSSAYVDMGHISQPRVIEAERKRKALKKADDDKIWGSSVAAITVHQ